MAFEAIAFWNYEKIAISKKRNKKEIIEMSISLRKQMMDQKKRWAPYPAQLRTGQNAHIS